MGETTGAAPAPGRQDAPAPETAEGPAPQAAVVLPHPGLGEMGGQDVRDQPVEPLHLLVRPG
ncbi:hypothetical protein, partial [Streptomyces zhihengii]